MGLTEDPPGSGLYAWSNGLSDSSGVSLVESVAALLTRQDCGDPVEDDAAVAAAVDTVTVLARAYTRGRGFAEDGPNTDISAVIITAAARLVSNPRQFGVEWPVGHTGNKVLRGGFTGWSLAEQTALNRYRVRAQ